MLFHPRVKCYISCGRKWGVGRGLSPGFACYASHRPSPFTGYSEPCRVACLREYRQYTTINEPACSPCYAKPSFRGKVRFGSVTELG